MPQWDFLNFLATQAKRYPAFHLRMSAEVTDLIEEGGRVVGVKAKTEQGSSTCGPTSSSGRTAGIPPCASGRG